MRPYRQNSTVCIKSFYCIPLGNGSRDTLPDNMVNFRKRRKVCEIIDDIKRRQLQPHNFRSIAPVLNFIEESLNS